MKNLAIISALFLALAVNLTAQEVENPTFAQFVAQFPQASLPYSLDAEALAANPAAKTARLDWQYYQFLPELERSAQASNMPVYPEPVAVFETKGNIAVLYNAARGTSRNPVSAYSISVFDRAGNHIGTHFVAGTNGKVLTTATIYAHLTAEMNTRSIIEGGLENQEPSTRQLDLVAPSNSNPADWSAVSTNNGFGIAKN